MAPERNKKRGRNNGRDSPPPPGKRQKKTSGQVVDVLGPPDLTASIQGGRDGNQGLAVTRREPASSDGAAAVAAMQQGGRAQPAAISMEQQTAHSMVSTFYNALPAGTKANLFLSSSEAVSADTMARLEGKFQRSKALSLPSKSRRAQRRPPQAQRRPPQAQLPEAAPAPPAAAPPAAAPPAAAPRRPARVVQTVYGSVEPHEFTPTPGQVYTCGNCGRIGHTVRECIKASPVGFVIACPRCNKGDHVLNACTALDADKAALWQLLLVDRRQKPPIAICGQSWLELLPGSEKMIPVVDTLPWSRKFAAKWVRTFGADWFEAYNYNASPPPSLGSDPRTVSVSTLMTLDPADEMYRPQTAREVAAQVAAQGVPPTDIERDLDMLQAHMHPDMVGSRHNPGAAAALGAESLDFMDRADDVAAQAQGSSATPSETSGPKKSGAAVASTKAPRGRKLPAHKFD